MAGKKRRARRRLARGQLSAEVKITRDGKTLLEEKSKPMVFE